VAWETFLHEGDLSLEVIFLADGGDSTVAYVLFFDACFFSVRLLVDVFFDVEEAFTSRGSDARKKFVI
jgi:hypothetical protein